MNDMTFAEAYRAVQPAVNQYKGWLYIAQALDKAAMAEDAAATFTRQAAEAKRAADDAKYLLNDLAAATDAARAGLDKALAEVRAKVADEQNEMRAALQAEEQELRANIDGLRAQVTQWADTLTKAKDDHALEVAALEAHRARIQKQIEEVEAARQALRAKL